MQKNATPRQLTFFASTIISVAFAVVYLIYNLVVYKSMNAQPLIYLLPPLFAISFAAFFYSLKWYIFRKVKLIYKSIHKQKLIGKDKFTTVNMNEDILGEVEREVLGWMKDNENEIAQLKSLEDYRRDYVGNVSHELKTPLFAIQGYIHTLLEGGLYDNQINIKFLQKAAKNIHRLQTIVEDLDTIGNLEGGQIMLNIETFSIRDLVVEVIEDLELLAKERNIMVQFKEGVRNNYLVSADRENIRQVLINLVNNSIKYGIENGQTKISFYDMEPNVLIEISDNGLGIDKEDIPYLFNRFYRVDKSRSRDAGGSGLGLAIVKHIIEAHRQTINVRSSPGIGSTFGFTLKKEG